MGGWGAGGRQRVASAAAKAGRVAAASRGARRSLPGAHEAGRASSSSQRPGSSSPGRRWREEGPRPLRPGTSATLARGSRSMATRRLPGTPASRRGRARARDAGGRCGGDWEPRTGAQRGRRGGGGPGRIRGLGPLHAGRAAPPPPEPRSRCRATHGPARGGEHHLPAGPAPACGRPGGGRGGSRAPPSPRTRLLGGRAGRRRPAPAQHRGGSGGRVGNPEMPAIAPPEPPMRSGQQVCMRGGQGPGQPPGCRADKAERSRALFPGARVQERAGEGAHTDLPILCPSRALPPCEGGSLETPGPTALSLVIFRKELLSPRHSHRASQAFFKESNIDG